MEYKTLIYEKEGSVAKIILNRPEKRNVLDLIGMGEEAVEFFAAFDEAAEDDEVKVVLLKGNGPCFCAGERLDTVYHVYGGGTGQPDERRPSQRIRLKLDRRFMDGFQRIFLHPKITVAQAHGYSFGIGTHLLLYCDFAVVTEDAQLGLIDQRLGSGGAAIPYIPILIMTVGMKRALDILLTTRLFDGKEAAQMGLVTKAVPHERMEEEVDKMVKALCLMPRDGIAIGKATRHMVYDSLGLTAGFAQGYVSHTLFTNLRWEPEEYSYLKQRRDKGLKGGLSGLHDRYAGLVDEGIKKIEASEEIKTCHSSLKASKY